MAYNGDTVSETDMDDLLNPIPADAVPASFAAAITRAEAEKERVILTLDGKPVAAIVPLDDIQTLEALEDAADASAAAAGLARWEAAGRPTVTLNEMVEKYGLDEEIDQP
jgi:antitoxin (DNA-binding transcriptional repressor) of toxin-antitoxin stability system